MIPKTTISLALIKQIMTTKGPKVPTPLEEKHLKLRQTSRVYFCASTGRLKNLENIKLHICAIKEYVISERDVQTGRKGLDKKKRGIFFYMVTPLLQDLIFAIIRPPCKYLIKGLGVSLIIEKLQITLKCTPVLYLEAELTNQM